MTTQLVQTKTAKLEDSTGLAIGAIVLLAGAGVAIWYFMTQTPEAKASAAAKAAATAGQTAAQAAAAGAQAAAAVMAGSGGSGGGGGGGTTPTPSLSIDNANSQINSRSTLKFHFNGFTPGAFVDVFVVGGGGITLVANALGGASGNFLDTDPPGDYTLQAQDSQGEHASANFIVN